MTAGRWRLATTGAALALAVSVAAQDAAPASPFPGVLDEHPAIQYATRPTTDAVARLDAALRAGSRTLTHEAGFGYLRAVLDGLGVPAESQLLVFSKSGIQRAFTSPSNPRALYYSPSVIVGYIAGAPALEIAAQDPQQGVAFYTLDQRPSAAPRFTRGTTCLTCHVSASTLGVPGPIARSNRVGRDGTLLPQYGGAVTVNHQTPHTQRWGGWFVTGDAFAPPYQPLGHLGNLTHEPHPTSGPPIVSNHVLVEWLGSGASARGYLAPTSDLAALLVFDHQMHAMNLLTRLNWEWRVALADGRARIEEEPFRSRVQELADYLLFVDEATPVVEVAPRAGFAERLVAAVPKDRHGRSLAQLDLVTRLMRYPVSYMIYSDAFDGLAAPLKDAVYRRLLTLLGTRSRDPRFAHLGSPAARAAAEILRDTKPDLPGRRRPATP
jgi:hypothetical protein